MLNWTDGWILTTRRGTEFVTLGDEGSFARSMARLAGIDSSAERFVLLKTRQSIDRLVELVRSLAPERIVELGIFRGGSTALLMELAEPEMLVAIDYEATPVTALETYVDRAGHRGSCHTVYGVDQADGKALTQILGESFGGSCLDLVVDDASHLGPQTRASFETLFPRVRPGGVYVIEDWSWHLQGLDLPGESMETFVADLLAAAGRGPGLIAGLELGWDAILVRRGETPIEAPSFALADWFDRML